ncbi:cupredoxin domain-containing protein [Massilia sp. TWR1-2-2]|uniref:cupredoxin domain-containing protein n=1 Tax=Massilia sp. TWR1-2-2 TaxID=2804584 RepID=UPI003CF18465
MKHILIAAATLALINGAAAHEGEHPAAAPQASPVQYQHDKSAAHPHGAAKAGPSHGAPIGIPGQGADAKRTVTVDMTDAMRFNPSSIKVKRGETVRFVVTNSGKLKHEMVLGSMSDLKKHADLMRKNPEMEHAEENMASVEPGKSGELIWKFTAAGKVDFVCLQPGHFDAGMKGKVAVK